jgi:hypothetical protein
MRSDFWNLPGPRRFLGDLTAELASGKNVSLTVPELDRPSGLTAAAHELCSVLLPRLEWDALSLKRLLAGGGLPHAQLWDHQGIAREPGQRLDAQALAHQPRFAGQIIWVSAAGAEDTQLAAWADFLDEYQAAGSSIAPSTRTRIVTTYTGDQDGRRAEPDVLNSELSWWGGLSRLDTTVFVEERAGPQDPILRAAIVEVARFDLALADELLRSWTGAWTELREILDRFKPAVACPELTLREWNATRVHASVPAALLPAWAAGAVDRWDEDSHALHSSLVDDVELARRVWRGQLATLLPLIEGHRRTLAEWVDAQRPWVPKGFVDVDIPALEIGSLASCFRAIRKEIRSRHRDDYLALAVWLKERRNDLAHCRLVEPQEVETGRTLMERVLPAIHRELSATP